MSYQYLIQAPGSTEPCHSLKDAHNWRPRGMADGASDSSARLTDVISSILGIRSVALQSKASLAEKSCVAAGLLSILKIRHEVFQRTSPVSTTVYQTGIVQHDATVARKWRNQGGGSMVTDINSLAINTGIFATPFA